MTALLRPERPYASRAEQLHDMARLVFEGGPPGDESPGYCLDPAGRDILATPEEIAAAYCAECKKHSILAARRAVDAGREVDLVFSMSPRLGHVSIRVDGVPRDPAREAGMPPPPPTINRGAVVVRVRRRNR